MRNMSYKVLHKLVKNLKDDFDTETGSITTYGEFENEVRLLLEKKAELNLLHEEKLKTEAQLTSLKRRDFWKEISHAISFVSIAITIIIALGDITQNSAFSLFALGSGIVIFPFAFIAIPCSKYLAGQIQYYEYKLKLINRFLEKEKNKKSNKLQVQTNRKCSH